MKKLILLFISLFFISCDIPDLNITGFDFEDLIQIEEYNCDPDEPFPDYFFAIGVLHPDCDCLTFMTPDGNGGGECNWDATTIGD